MSKKESQCGKFELWIFKFNLKFKHLVRAEWFTWSSNYLFFLGMIIICGPSRLFLPYLKFYTLHRTFYVNLRLEFINTLNIAKWIRFCTSILSLSPRPLTIGARCTVKWLIAPQWLVAVKREIGPPQNIFVPIIYYWYLWLNNNS